MIEIEKSEVFERKEVKTLICDFYKKEHSHISQFDDDEERYKELIFKLYQHLGYENQFNELSCEEKTLLRLISTYSYSLINEFKNVLKEVK